jgi:hypothetical protein
VSWGTRVLRLLAPDGTGAHPRRVWDDAFAGDPPWERAWLHEVEGEAVAWPCDKVGSGCERAVRVAPDDDWLAVCDDPFGCQPVMLRKRDVALFRLDTLAVADTLARSTHGLTSDVAHLPGAIVRVGTYVDADPQVVVYWSLASGVPQLPPAVGADQTVRVVISRRPVDGLRGLTSFDVVSWGDVVGIRDGRPVVDLSDLALSKPATFKNPGPLLGERFPLVLDPGGERVWANGHQVHALSTKVAARRFLVAVAWTPQQTVDHVTLMRRTYLDQSTKSLDKIDIIQAAERLKQIKATVRAALDDFGGADWVEAGGDHPGTYRLALAGAAVRWLTEPEWKR